jgi:hypothetical protein
LGLPFFEGTAGAQQRTRGNDGLSQHAEKCASFGLGLAVLSLHDLVPPKNTGLVMGFSDRLISFYSPPKAA